MTDADSALEVAREAAVKAGARLAERLGADVRISKKGPINLVTEMDLAAEKIIVECIQSRFPDHRILAEEEARREGRSPCRWIIDPLDGTTNYAHGYRFFCVSIALEVDGRVDLGVVYDPVTEELFWARRQGGAYLNGEPIRVSTQGRLGDSLLSTGFSYDRDEILVNLEHFNRLILECRAIRRDGSAALDLCYVAAGRFEALWEISLNAWDVAAGMLIVEEAGGRVSAFDGSPCSAYDREILASNGLVHDDLVRLLSS